MLAISNVLSTIEIAVALLIFGVGLPMYIDRQPLWLKRIRDDHTRLKFFNYLALGVISFLIVLMLGYLFDPSFLLDCEKPEGMVAPTLCSARRFMRLYSNQVISLLLLISIGLVILITMLMRTYTPAYLLNVLQKNSLVKLSNNVLPEDEIRAIGTIGFHAESAEDKGEVLGVLNKLAVNISVSDNDSTVLLEAVSFTLESARSDSFAKATQVYRTLILRMREPQTIALDITLNGLEDTGTKAIMLGAYDSIYGYLGCIQLVPLLHQGRSLYRLGLETLSQEKYSLAVRFFDQLETIAEYCLTPDGSVQADEKQSRMKSVVLYVGFVAYYISLGGNTSQRVMDRFLNVFKSSGTDINEFLKICRSHYDDLSEYHTVDRIKQLEDALKTEEA